MENKVVVTITYSVIYDSGEGPVQWLYGVSEKEANDAIDQLISRNENGGGYVRSCHVEKIIHTEEVSIIKQFVVNNPKK